MFNAPYGFTDPLPAESGQNGTVVGRIIGDDTIEAFMLVKTILRTFGGAGNNGPSVLSGTWTIEIMETEDEDSTVLFDQSVEVNILLVEVPFSIIYDWSFVGSTYKIKTRIANGAPVPVVVPAYTGKADPAPRTGAPAEPGYALLSRLRQQTIRATMPDLPGGAESLALLIAKTPDGPWLVYRDKLKQGDFFDVEARAIGLEKPEDMWLRVRAVNAAGYRDGPRIQDSYTVLDARNNQIAGYEGWRFTDNDRPTVFSEQWSGDAENGQTMISGQIRGAVWMPAYRCTLPPGCIIKVRHDNWANAIVIANKFTFAVAYRAGSPYTSIIDRDLGTFWVGVQRHQPGVATSRQFNEFALDDSVAQVVGDAVRGTHLLRHGKTLYNVLDRGGQVAVARSDDGGTTWKTEDVMRGLNVLQANISNDGSRIVLYGKATENGANGVVQGKPVTAVLRLGAENTYATDGVRRPAGDGLPTANVAGLLDGGHSWYVVAVDGGTVTVHGSQDELRSFSLLKATGTTQG